MSQIVENNQSNFVTYQVDSQIYLNGKDLFNVMMVGINPLSLLQYGLVDLNRWDSVTNQIYRDGRQVSVISNNNYDEDSVHNLAYPEIQNFLNDFPEYLYKDRNTALFYVDNQMHSAHDYLQLARKTWDQESNDNNQTAFIFYEPFKPATHGSGWQWHINKLHILSPTVWQGRDIYLIYDYAHPIDSIASTLACLLDIPLPIQNHGVMLPGAVFEEKKEINESLVDNSELLQFYDNMVNLEQLSTHLYYLDKTSPLWLLEKQSKQTLEVELEMQTKNPNKSQLVEMIKQTRLESAKLNEKLNSEISGNLFILFLGLVFCLSAFGLFYKKVINTKELYGNVSMITQTDFMMFILIFVISFFQRSYQLEVTCMLCYAIIIKATKPLSLKKRLEAHLQVFYCICYLCIPFSNFGLLLEIGFLILTIWMLVIFIRGFWSFVIQKESQEALMFCQVSLFVILFSYLRIPTLQDLAQYTSLILGSTVFTTRIFKRINIEGRFLIFMIMIYSLIQDYLPFGFMGSILVLSRVEVSLRRNELDIHQQNQNRVISDPFQMLIFLIIYQSSLYQLPQSPFIFDLSAFIIQSYCVLFYMSVRKFLEVAYQETSSSIAVKKTISIWSTSVYETFGKDGSSLDFSYCDTQIVWGLMNFFNWVCILLNEMFKYDTSPTYIGQEYYYLQDAVSYLMFLLIVAYLIQVKYKQEDEEVLNTDVDEIQLDRYQSNPSTRGYSYEMDEIQL